MEVTDGRQINLNKPLEATGRPQHFFGPETDGQKSQYDSRYRAQKYGLRQGCQSWPPRSRQRQREMRKMDALVGEG